VGASFFDNIGTGGRRVVRLVEDRGAGPRFLRSASKVHVDLLLAQPSQMGVGEMSEDTDVSIGKHRTFRAWHASQAFDIRF